MAQVKGQPKEKEPTTSVSEVYYQVVGDVIDSVREDFQSEGVDESVLAELRDLWELKMMQTGAIDTAPMRDANAPASGKNNSAPMHDLNVPYEGTDEYQTPTMDILFPPTPQTMTPQVGTPVMTPLAMTPLPMTPVPTTPQVQQADPTSLQMATPGAPQTGGGEPVVFQYISSGPQQAEDGKAFEASPDVKVGAAAPWMNNNNNNNNARGVDVNLDMNASYEEGPVEDESLAGEAPPVTKDFFTLSAGKRKRDEPAGPRSGGNNIPQQDGAGDDSSEPESRAGDASPRQEATCFDGIRLEKDSRGSNDLEQPNLVFPLMRLTSSVPQCGSSSGIKQFDGMDDDYDGVAEEDYNDAGYDDAQRGELGSRTSAGDAGDGLSDGEPPLNEDDDNDQGEGDDEPQTDHLVLAQFEKVTRSKNKWKCTLKDGVMHLNKKDVLFVRATGEFVF